MDSDIFLRDITHARDDEDPRRRPRKEEGLSSLDDDHANDDADSLVRLPHLATRACLVAGDASLGNAKRTLEECRDEKQRCLLGEENHRSRCGAIRRALRADTRVSQRPMVELYETNARVLTIDASCSEHIMDWKLSGRFLSLVRVGDGV